jgi:hypothetical protein
VRSTRGAKAYSRLVQIRGWVLVASSPSPVYVVTGKTTDISVHVLFHFTFF